MCRETGFAAQFLSAMLYAMHPTIIHPIRSRLTEPYQCAPGKELAAKSECQLRNTVELETIYLLIYILYMVECVRLGHRVKAGLIECLTA